MRTRRHTSRNALGVERIFLRLALFAVMAMAITAATIQPAMAIMNDGLRPSEEHPRADDIRETVEIYMLAKMKRALDLSREQEERLVPLVQELSEARREFANQRRITMGRLRPLTRDPEAEDEEFSKILGRLHETERAFRDLEAGSHKEIQSILTLRQQAQFIIFQERFQSEMQRRLRRMREMRGPGTRQLERDRSTTGNRRRREGGR